MRIFIQLLERSPTLVSRKIFFSPFFASKLSKGNPSGGSFLPKKLFVEVRRLVWHDMFQPESDKGLWLMGNQPISHPSISVGPLVSLGPSRSL